MFVVSADVGATNLRVALFSSEGSIIRVVSTRTPREGGSNVIAETIYELAVKLIKESNLNLENLLGIGVGSIGPLDIRRGDVVSTPNLPLRNFKLREPLMDLFGTESVYVVNDCVAAVWGEKNFGLGRGVSNIVYVTISTGVGAGVIVNDNLLLGKDGNAHEVGHIVVKYDGLTCSCGGVGHWEAYVSGSGIPRYVRYYVSNLSHGRKSRLTEILEVRDVTPEEFFLLVREGDTLATEIHRTMLMVNAAGFASVINAYDPELITVGGSIALNEYDILIEPMLKHLSNYVLNRPPVITPTTLGGNAVLIGAASLVINPPKELLRIYSLS